MAVERQPVTEPQAKDIAATATILQARVGSTAHGVGTGDDDRDEMGICVEPMEAVLGLRHFEQWTHRTQPEGTRSGPGDLDVVVYGLRKYCSLALKGNPSVLLLLMVPDEDLVTTTPHGDHLRRNADLFASKKAGAAFLGYMQQQRERLLGHRGQKGVKRPELVERHGYDTKFAGHMIRLGFQGVDYMATGRFPIPMPDIQRDVILSVRRGERTQAEALAIAVSLEEMLKLAIAETGLPDQPDYHGVNAMLVEIHLNWWGLA